MFIMIPNQLVEIYRKHLAKTQGRGSNGFSALGPETVGFAADEEEDKEEGGGGNGDNESSMVQSAILLSFASNVVLLVMKGWMAILTGSMSIIASTADSLLDLLSGAVLLMADRAAHKNVNHYEYPEGRSRMEPIGIIIFSTVMCLSSLNILYESLKIVANGYLGEPRDLEVEFWGFVVLFLTIAIKLALWAYCSFVLRVSENKSGSVEAYAQLCLFSCLPLFSLVLSSFSHRHFFFYVLLFLSLTSLLFSFSFLIFRCGASPFFSFTQDHLNDVVTNLVAVVCVYAAVAGPSGWWVADPLGAAAISVWIMYSWWDVGKEHVDHLSGRVAPVDFLQQLTFIAANCDELILQVDTVRAFHFGDRFLVEVHVVLDPALPLRAAHDVGEKLEAMVEKLQEVERCFVHMDYETSHEPEYKRRLASSPRNA